MCLVGILFLLLWINCGSGGCGGTTAVDLAPVADAGDDQNVNALDTVMLDGSGSTSAFGYSLTYAWTQISGTSVTLSDPTAVKPTFAASSIPDALVFQLVVTDMVKSSAPATVTINVWMNYSSRLFVDASASSSGADGTQEHPYTTINDAIDVSIGQDVYVAAGTYNENIEMAEGVSLFGGYEAAGWTRNIATNTTTINPAAPYQTAEIGEGKLAETFSVGIYAGSGITASTYINGFTLNGPILTDEETGALSLVAVDGASPIVSNNIIAGGTAVAEDASAASIGCYINSENMEISGNIITTGSSDSGMAVGPYIYGCTTSISNNTISGSGLDAYSAPGGAIMIVMIDATAMIEENTIDAGKNYGATNMPGTLGILSGNATTATISRNYIDGGDGVSIATAESVLPGSAGIIAANDSNLTIVNNIIYGGNGYAEVGAYAYWDSWGIIYQTADPEEMVNVDITNNTIYVGENTTSGYLEGGVLSSGLANAKIVNNIFIATVSDTQSVLLRTAVTNSAFESVYNNDFYVSGGGAYYMYMPSPLNPEPDTYTTLDTMITALTVEGVSTIGNIDDNPLFQEGSDYLLQALSPCIGAGCSSDCGVDIPTEDYDGNTRPSGDIDLGASQYQ